MLTDVTTSDIWVFGDLRTRHLLDLSFNVVAKAAALARAFDGRVVLFMFTANPNDLPTVADGDACVIDTRMEEDAYAAGADEILRIENRHFGTPTVHLFASALTPILKESRPRLVLFPLTDFGRDLDGNTGPAVADFFTINIGAADIALNSVIANDTNRIAAADIGENVPGGNSNAITIAEMQNQLLMSTNSATIDDFFNGLVSDVGRHVSQAKVNANHQSTVALQLDTYREEVSGVSMDEEMVNMVQFQSAYQAAAKLVNTVDEMLESLIAMV